MKKILGYLETYWDETDKRSFLTAAFLTALGIFINYYYQLNQQIAHLGEGYEYISWSLVFLTAFSTGYALVIIVGERKKQLNKKFYLLLFLAPAIFAWKMVFDVNVRITPDEMLNTYWNRVIYWPFKLLIVTGILYLIWKFTREKQPFYGLSSQGFNPRPYVLMLFIMVPLIAAASTQQDFLYTYPKLKNVIFLSTGMDTGMHKLLYEISYGLDFFTIELFFRGFLVLAFSKWFGKDAILPMAMFYCTIHFGKPLGECISSFFGGIILGVVTFHTRTIYGGLMVHVGIAWMMELGGYLGNYYLK